MGRRRKWGTEFMSEAVRLVKKAKRPLNVVARELGVPTTTLWVWVHGKEARRDGEIPLESKSVEALTLEEKDAELRRLRNEVATLREEKEILKKAAAFFAKENT